MHAVLLGLLLTVRIYDTAGLSPAATSSAVRVAAGIFDAAGIDTAWILCAAPGRSAPANPPECAQSLAPSTLMVRIIPRQLAPGAADALGGACVDTAAREGTLATVYLDRVISVAGRAQVHLGRLAGWTVAHELGHLLLGTAHTAQGLMQAQWSTATLKDPSGGNWRFSASEAALLVERLKARSQRRELVAGQQ